MSGQSMKEKMQFISLIASIIISSCLMFEPFPDKPEEWKSPCDNPISLEEVNKNQLIGRWVLSHNDNSYYEEIEILNDAQYQQTVEKGAMDYVSPQLTWYIEEDKNNYTYLYYFFYSTL